MKVLLLERTNVVLRLVEIIALADMQLTKRCSLLMVCPAASLRLQLSEPRSDWS